MIKAIFCDFANVLFLREIYREHLNEQLLSYLKGLSPRLELFIFTNSNPRYYPEFDLLKKIFSRIIVADNNLDKREHTSYEELSRQFGYNPAEIVFIDDQEYNINAAKQANWNTILFRSTETTITELSKFLKIDNVH